MNHATAENQPSPRRPPRSYSIRRLVSATMSPSDDADLTRLYASTARLEVTTLADVGLSASLWANSLRAITYAGSCGPANDMTALTVLGFNVCKDLPRACPSH